MNLKGLEKVTGLEQFSTPYVLKGFFWETGRKVGDSRRGSTFLQISLSFCTYMNFFDMSGASASGPAASSIDILHTQTPVLQCCVPATLVFCAGPNAFLLAFLRFMSLLLQNIISQHTSPICSWLESTLVRLSCLLSIKIKKEPYLYVRQWSISDVPCVALGSVCWWGYCHAWTAWDNHPPSTDHLLVLHKYGP